MTRIIKWKVVASTTMFATGRKDAIYKAKQLFRIGAGSFRAKRVRR